MQITNEEKTLQAIREAIAQLPVGQQVAVEDLASSLRSMLARLPGTGLLALALVGAEQAVD